MSDARDRMIDSAITLLARDGFAATSLSAVLADSGAPRGSIYHHFPGGKDELIVAALDRFTGASLERLQGVRGRSPDAVIAAFAGGWRAVLVDGDCTVGCPLMAAATAAEVQPPVAAAVRRSFARWETALADVLVAGGGATERASALARYLIAAYEGALLLGRAQRSLEVFDAVDAEIRRAATGPAAG